MKTDHIKAALILSELLEKEESKTIKRIFAKAIIANLKAHLKQEK